MNDVTKSLHLIDNDAADEADEADEAEAGDEPNMGLAGRLRWLMGNETHAAFARRCGIGKSTMRKYLAGSDPSTQRAVRMASANGVSVDWLATGREPAAEATLEATAPEADTVPAATCDLLLQVVQRLLLLTAPAAAAQAPAPAAAAAPPADGLFGLSTDMGAGFARRLQALLAARGVADLARQCAVAEADLWDLLTRQRLPGMDELVAVADATGVTIDWLARGRRVAPSFMAAQPAATTAEERAP